MARKAPTFDPTLAVMGCSGGPRHGYWYGAEHWSASVRMGHDQGADPRRDTFLGYVNTGAVHGHPRFPELAGTVWRWNPNVAADQIKAGTHGQPPPPPRRGTAPRT